MIVLLTAFFALFTALRPTVFLNPVNLQNIGVAAPEIGLVSLAMMLAMLISGIDLSIVSIANGAAIAVSALYGGIAASAGETVAEAMTVPILLAGLAVGALLGSVNGLLISVLGITPILTTLGTMQLFNGLALVWTGGVTISGAPSALSAFGRGTLAGIPAMFLLLIAVAVVLGVIVGRTPLGLKAQLLGSNPTAARFSGINSRATIMTTYILSGLLGGIAGLVFLARNPSASADYGSSYVLLAIVVAVLGGTNPNGGTATVLGVVLAALTLQVVSSGFSALRLSAYEYAIAQGLLLISVMVFDDLKFRHRRRVRFLATEPTPPAEATAAARKDEGLQ